MKQFSFIFSCLVVRASKSLSAAVKRKRTGLLLAILLVTLYAGGQFAQAASPTTTTLTVTSAGSPVTTVVTPSVVTLTATVLASGTPVTVGQVNFCDAAATHCTDIHILVTAQLTSAGSATFKFRPAPGSHSYKAVFLGTTTNATSTSGPSDLSVTATGPYATLGLGLTATPNPGNAAVSTLTATLRRNGPLSPVPTGRILFIDYNHGNAPLGNAALGADNPLSRLNSPQGFYTGSTVNPHALSGAGLNSVAVADFNGDGIPDLAVESDGFSSSADHGIFLGNGNGSFTQSSASPALISGIIAADFNGDGKADLLDGDNVLLGNGDGTFSTLYQSVPNGITVVGDFNGDGIPDVVVTTTTTASGSIVTTHVTAYLGKGDGTFTAATSLTPSAAFAQYPTMTVAGDFNGDGRTDLALGYSVPGNSGIVPLAILLGNGDGAFTPGQTPTLTGSAVNALVAGDFNGDGHADLAVAGSVGSGILLLLGQGDGTFTTAPALPLAYNATGQPSATIGDFDGDGIPDLAVAFFGVATQYPSVNSGVTIYTGNGDGTFTKAAFAAAGFNSSSIAAADFTGYGVSDLAVYNNTGSTSYSPFQSPPQFYSSTATIFTPEFSQSATLTGVSPASPGVHEVEAIYPGDDLYTTITSGTTQINGPLGAPVFTPPGGNYSSPQSVTLTMPYVFSGEAIYYTTDGTTPTTSSNLYTAPITVQTAETIQAITAATGFANSPVASATYTFGPPPVAAPVFSLPAGVYYTTQTVTITDATPGATIYYTLNGSQPTTSSFHYIHPVAIKAAETLKAIAVAPSLSQSSVASAYYALTAPTPVISPAGGTFSGPQTVTITTATPIEAIFYTTAGNLPTTSSAHYTGPITVSSTEKVIAFAAQTGFISSPYVSQKFTITKPAAATDTH